MRSLYGILKDAAKAVAPRLKLHFFEDPAKHVIRTTVVIASDISLDPLMFLDAEDQRAANRLLAAALEGALMNIEKAAIVIRKELEA